MKYDFTFQNKTKIYFGKDSLQYLKEELKHYGKRILFVYGGGSIKKIHLYEKIIQILKDADKTYFELSNVMPNPTYKKMMEGVDLVRKHQIDLILAVGGGSVIDCAKGISVSAYCQEDAFETYWLKQEPVDHFVVPVGSILTMVGTGSEMNGGSVITDEKRKMKVGRVFEGANPVFSILNPEYTYSVSKYQMVSGIFDIMSHLMEQYFSNDDDNVSDDLIEAMLKSLIKNTKKALINPQDYEARSNLMWLSTIALNELVGCSKIQDWNVHNIEHQIGAYTDCAHGMGLAAISVAYYRYIYAYGLAKFKRFAIEVFNVLANGKTDEQIALDGIDELATFIQECGMVTNLRELGVKDEKQLQEIAASVQISPTSYRKLNQEDVYWILKESF